MIIVTGNIFVVIVYKLLERQKKWKVILKVALKLMVKKRNKMPKKVNTLGSKIMKEK